MSNSQKIMVVGTIIIGLIPGFLIYQFFTSHPNILNLGEKENFNLPPNTSDELLVNRNLISKIYLSAPKKEDDILCSHSNYSSLILVLKKNGEFNLSKKCESNKDNMISWSGLASSTITTIENSDNTENLKLIVTNTGDSQYLVFNRKDDELILIETNIKGLATSTSLTLVDSFKQTTPTQ